MWSAFSSPAFFISSPFQISFSFASLDSSCFWQVNPSAFSGSFWEEAFWQESSSSLRIILPPHRDRSLSISALILFPPFQTEASGSPEQGREATPWNRNGSNYSSRKTDFLPNLWCGETACRGRLIPFLSLRADFHFLPNPPPTFSLSRDPWRFYPLLLPSATLSGRHFNSPGNFPPASGRTIHRMWRDSCQPSFFLIHGF